VRHGLAEEAEVGGLDVVGLGYLVGVVGQVVVGQVVDIAVWVGFLCV
jgi:hypothetical protein